MELEHRVEKLEREVATLKEEIQGTLLDIQRGLSEKSDTPSRWRKKAWVLALLNVLLSITLFTNIRFYTSDTLPGASSSLGPWGQAFWIALAFVWLILQMYPLALLLNQEEEQLSRATWRNAATLLVSNPGLTAALTLLVLIVAIVGALLPSLWFVVVAGLCVVVCASIWRYLLQLHRERARK